MQNKSVLNRAFIDDFTEIENNNPSDYYGSTNVTRILSSTEEDNFSQSDVDAFLEDDVEARNFLPPNYGHNKEDSVDDFVNTENRVEKFKDTLLIPHEKDDNNSFLYSICYAICFLRTKKSLKCDDDKLAKDMPENLFQKLSTSREGLCSI